MANPTKVKTTDEGVDIYVDPDTGTFVAVTGDCNCSRRDDVPRAGNGHYYRCTAKTISRKSMADLERELRKAAAPKTPLRVIGVESTAPPREAQIIGVETDRNGYHDRYRYASGDLSSRWGETMRIYSDEAWIKLTAAYERLQAASREYQEIQVDHALLPPVTRENFKELLAKQNEANGTA
jgi:hypothetical protein